MKIALLTYSTRPRGGVVHTLALGEALAGLGEDVTIYAVGPPGAAFFRPVDRGVEVRIGVRAEVPGESVGDRILRSIAALSRAVDPGEFDVVHAQDCISANAVPDCVRTVHHIDSFTTPELVACHERAILTPRAHVCVSGSVAAELAHGWGITARVIPNGVNYARFANAVAVPRAGPYVLSVGGIEPRKGSIDLLEAWALAGLSSGSTGGGEWVIAGGETLFDYRAYRAAFEDRAQQLGVAPTILGPVDHDVLPGLVAGASLFAFPSTKEGFGLAAMEALAAGVPVVVRDLPVLREVFGTTVRYAADVEGFADAIRTVMNGAGGPDGPGGCGGCGGLDPAAGRALAASLTWDAAARAHVAFYREVLDRGG